MLHLIHESAQVVLGFGQGGSLHLAKIANSPSTCKPSKSNREASGSPDPRYETPQAPTNQALGSILLPNPTLSRIRSLLLLDLPRSIVDLQLHFFNAPVEVYHRLHNLKEVALLRLEHLFTSRYLHAI